MEGHALLLEGLRSPTSLVPCHDKTQFQGPNADSPISSAEPSNFPKQIRRVTKDAQSNKGNARIQMNPKIGATIHTGAVIERIGDPKTLGEVFGGDVR